MNEALTPLPTLADATAASSGVGSRRRWSIGVLIAWGIIGIVMFCAAFGQLIAPFDAQSQDLLTGLAGPNSAHLLGTDDLGRDVLSRAIVGAKTAVVGPILISIGAMLFGSMLGVIAGYLGGWIDAVIMRWADLMYAIPGLLIAIVVVGVLGGGYYRAVILLTILFVPYDARIVRASALEQRSRPYVEAARTLGLSSGRIMLGQIWPNLLPLIMSKGALNYALALVNLSALSFLGLGAEPTSADWGRMLSDSRSTLYGNPLTAVVPGLLLVVTATCMNYVGDWLYEVLTDRGRAR